MLRIYLVPQLLEWYQLKHTELYDKNRLNILIIWTEYYLI